MITILLFGELKEKLGKDQIQTAVAKPLKVESLFCQILGDDPGLMRWQDKVLYAVNQEQVSAQTLVRDGDEVAFMPPMAGG